MDTTAPARARAGSWVLRVAVILHLVALLWEAVTAGQLVAFNLEALPLHYSGAFAVHVAAGVQVLAAARVWFGSGREHGAVLLALSALALLLGFAQAATGTYGSLQSHVPLAILLTGLVACTAALSWRH